MIGADAAQPLDRGDAHLAHEVRILAEGLLYPPPPRIARDVHNRGENQVDAARANLTGDEIVDVANEVGIPCAGEANGLREGGGILRRETVERFFVEKDGYAEAGVLHRPALRFGDVSDRILDGAARIGARAARAAGIAGPRDLADAVGIDLRRLGRRETVVGVLDVALAVPHGDDLGDLLVQRHAREKIGDPLFRRERGIPIGSIGHGARDGGRFLRLRGNRQGT